MCHSGGGGGAIMVLCRLVMKKAFMCFASNTDQLFDHFCNFNNFDFFGGMERFTKSYRIVDQLSSKLKLVFLIHITVLYSSAGTIVMKRS